MPQHEISSMPQCPPGEPQTWKDFRVIETIQASFLCPCMDMKVDMCRPAVLPEQPNSGVETLSQVKVHGASAPTDSLRGSVSSLLELAFHYKAKQITTESLFI